MSVPEGRRVPEVGVAAIDNLRLPVSWDRQDPQVLEVLVLTMVTPEAIPETEDGHTCPKIENVLTYVEIIQ